MGRQLGRLGNLCVSLCKFVGFYFTVLLLSREKDLGGF